jgi:nucleoside phosphorylase/CheY-like chemotaxis protein
MKFKILITDDNHARASEIEQIISKYDKSNIEIQFADNGSSALKIFEKESIDLFIVDISLPFRPSESPKHDGGVRLLEQLQRKTKYNKPRYVVGITAYEQIREKEQSFFENNLWYLIYETDGSQEWKEKLDNFYNYILQANIKGTTQQYEVDVFVIAALREVELKALLDLPFEWSEPIPLDDSSFYRKAKLNILGKDYSLCIGSPPEMGLVSTTMYSQKVIEKLRPRYIAMNGICAGIEDRCNIGDVLLASPTWEWQSGKYLSPEQGFQIEPKQVSLPDYILSRFEQIAEDQASLHDIYLSWKGSKPSSSPKLHIGPVVSGSSVLSSSTMVDDIKDQHRKLLGIEMEIYGMYYSAVHASSPKPSFFALKSVCDFANEQKSDDFQDYCAYMSTKVLINFLETFLPEIIDKSGQF